MSEQRRRAGFLTSLAKTPLGDLLWPEGLGAALIGIGGGTALLSITGVAERLALVGDGLQLLGVLLGVVFAAFALMIAFFSDDYVRALDGVDGGIGSFMRPFTIAVGVQLTTIFVTLGYRAAGSWLPETIEKVVFVAWAFLLAYALLDVMALARNISMHGLARAHQLKLRSGSGGDVSELRRRQG